MVALSRAFKRLSLYLSGEHIPCPQCDYTMASSLAPVGWQVINLLRLRVVRSCELKFPEKATSVWKILHIN